MLKSFVKFLIDPFNILWLLLLLFGVTWYFNKKRICKWLIITAGIWFLLISTPLLPNLVLQSLENQYSPINVNELFNPQAQYHILILGGGHGYDDRLPANSLLSLNALGRLNEGIRLHRQLTNSTLILSGYTSTPGRTTQAEMLQQTAISLGIDRNATLLQNSPGNTFEEAKIYAENFGHTHPLILVTSAAHMPRAMNVFRRFGLDPIPSPTNYRLKGSWKQKWIGVPTLGNIENMRMAIYEYAGNAWYSIKS